MKLKKVLSLVLCGVMALSMLAGCSGTTTGTETPIDTATTTSAGTTVVAKVQAGMDEDKVGEHQAGVTLSGNEETDLKMIREWMAGRGTFSTTAAIQNISEINASALNGMKMGTTGMYVMPVGGLTDQDVADDLLNFMADRWDYVDKKASGSKDKFYAIGKISVFKFSDPTDSLSVGDPYIEIDGVTYDMSEVYFIVITISSSVTLA